MKIKKTYSFAFFSSIYITLFTVVTLFLITYFVFNVITEVWYWALFIIIVFVFTFIITQFRIEKFIYQRVKNIYDSVSLLDSSDFHKTAITSDIAMLSREVEKFAKDKQLQIKNLNKREGYRREFLGNISHELKTPLFTVQGYLLTLADGAINDAKIRDKYIDRANKGVERLIAIVKDLDLISKLEAADLNINKEPFDIVKLIKEVYDMLEIKAKKRNVTLLLNKRYHYPIMVVGDKERYEQVLTNLLVNSIKYGLIGGTTMVTIESYNKNKIIVKVIDNGEGIKPEDQVRLFERFYRVDRSRSRDQGGSGLGLSIVKHIVEAHGEEIFVKSEYKKGAEFSFTIEKAEKFLNL